MNRRAIKFVRAVFLAFIAFAHFSTAQVITTIAGGAGVFRGDGGPAGQATLGEMRGVAVDAAGNVYAADMDHSLVVKITPGGVVTVVAGNGIRGFSGDGGPATSASLNYPQGLALDSAGNLYIADFENYRVRKVTPSGIISTVAGNGQTGFSGDGGPALNASLPGPGGIVLDAASNLYVSDSNNNRIRKVDTNGIITTIAGTGPTGVGTGGFSGDGGPAQSARLNSPKGIVLDRTGNLYVADSLSHRIRKISVNGIITTVAGTGQESNSGDDGPAANAAVSRPVWLALDAAGGLYIGAGGNRIRKISPAGIIATFAGNGQTGFSGDGGPATSAAIVNNGFQPGVAVDTVGNLYIADTGNYRIRRVNADGTISTVAGSSNGRGSCIRLRDRTRRHKSSSHHRPARARFVIECHDPCHGYRRRHPRCGPICRTCPGLCRSVSGKRADSHGAHAGLSRTCPEPRRHSQQHRHPVNSIGGQVYSP